MEEIFKRLENLIYEIDNYRKTMNALSNELSEIHQALQLLQPDVIKSVCEHPYATIIGEEHGNPKCLKCGKKLQ